MLHNAADLKRRKCDHSENAKSQISKDEQAVQDLEACLKEWESNPWDLSSSSLRTLDSGRIASESLIADFESAKETGDTIVNKIL